LVLARPSWSDGQLLDAEEFCRHLVESDSVHAILADHRGQLFPDEQFEDLFPSGRGRPSVPADVIATVMVRQPLKRLSDREACRALQCDIAWKVAYGLGLTDEAFHPTVLVLWQNKLRASTHPKRTTPDRIVSVVDPESRHVHKTQHAYRDGFKAHIAAEPETGIITATDLTSGHVGDAQAGPTLLENEPAGTEVLGDCLRIPQPPPTPGRPRVDRCHQAHAAAGRGRRRLHPRRLHHRHRGQRHHLSRGDHRHHHQETPCPLRQALCHLSGPASMHQSQGRADHRAARRTWPAGCWLLHRVTATTEEFETTYRNLEPMVERTLVWLVGKNARQVRYRGNEHNKLFLSHRAAAVNLTRLVNLGVSHDGTTWVMQAG
jgi:hypothetical protein